MNARTDRHAHLDLLEQVADNTDERDNVRRILGEPAVELEPGWKVERLDEHELDTLARYKRAARYPIRFAACANGPCAQGRKLCPTPQACQVSAEPDKPRPLRDWFECARDLALVIALYAAGAAGAAAVGVGVGWLIGMALDAMGVRL